MGLLNRVILWPFDVLLEKVGLIYYMQRISSVLLNESLARLVSYLSRFFSLPLIYV